MSRKIDITGQRFGNWLVIGESLNRPLGQQGFVHWDCKCLICNRIYSVSGVRLRQGKTKSCVECAGSAKIELTGKTINNWLVLKESEQKKSGDTQVFWDCRCLTCNKIYSIPGGRLRSGKSQKCKNCYFDETRFDLTNQRVGAWMVENRSEKRTNKRTLWNCRCLGCNQLYVVDGADLRYGKTKICKTCSTDLSKKNLYYEYNDETDCFQNKNYQLFTDDEILKFPVKQGRQFLSRD